MKDVNTKREVERYQTKTLQYLQLGSSTPILLSISSAFDHFFNKETSDKKE